MSGCPTASFATERNRRPGWLDIRACQAGHQVLFAAASEWVAHLAAAHHVGWPKAELGRYPLLVVDEVGSRWVFH